MSRSGAEAHPLSSKVPGTAEGGLEMGTIEILESGIMRLEYRTRYLSRQHLK